MLLFSTVLVVGQDKRPVPPQRSVSKLSAMIDRARPSVVKITAYFGPPMSINEGTGTGFFVNARGIVVTAKHVISSQPHTPCDTSPVRPSQPPDFHATAKPIQASKILIGIPEAPMHVGGVTMTGSFRDTPARVLACDDVHDIAVLEPQGNPITMSFPPMVRVEGKEIPAQPSKRGPAVLSAKAFRDGDPVFTSGYPLTNSTLVTTSGYIASSAPIGVNEQTGKFEDAYWADIHVNPGNSGGPAFSLESGAVLGMILSYQNAPVFLDDGHSPACFPWQAPNQPAVSRCLEFNSGIAGIMPVEFIRRLLHTNKVEFEEH
jgi:S1-C subfamily serine protease